MEFPTKGWIGSPTGFAVADDGVDGAEADRLVAVEKDLVMVRPDGLG